MSRPHKLARNTSRHFLQLRYASFKLQRSKEILRTVSLCTMYYSSSVPQYIHCTSLRLKCPQFVNGGRNFLLTLHRCQTGNARGRRRFRRGQFRYTSHIWLCSLTQGRSRSSGTPCTRFRSKGSTERFGSSWNSQPVWRLLVQANDERSTHTH